MKDRVATTNPQPASYRVRSAWWDPLSARCRAEHQSPLIVDRLSLPPHAGVIASSLATPDLLPSPPSWGAQRSFLQIACGPILPAPPVVPPRSAAVALFLVPIASTRAVPALVFRSSRSPKLDSIAAGRLRLMARQPRSQNGTAQLAAYRVLWSHISMNQVLPSM